MPFIVYDHVVEMICLGRGPTKDGQMLIRRLLLCLMLVAGLSCTKDDPESPLPAPTTHEFTIPLTQGTTWVYRYTYHSSEENSNWFEIHGIRTWQEIVTGTSTVPHIYGLMASIRDSVHHTMITGQSAMLDTTYVIEQSIPFYATVSQDSIDFGWGSMMRIHIWAPDSLLRLPRVVPVSTDTLNLSLGPQGAGGVARYVTGIGLVKYDFILAVAKSTYEEHLVLLSVSVK